MYGLTVKSLGGDMMLKQRVSLTYIRYFYLFRPQRQRKMRIFVKVTFDFLLSLFPANEFSGNLQALADSN